MRARADSGARRAGGLLLAFMLVVSQASTWLHAVAISHVACLEHGEAMHGGAVAADEAREAQATGAPAVRADVATIAGHDHCGNAALLRWRDVALTAPPALPLPAAAARSTVSADTQEAVGGVVVYLVAPKTSPPAARA
jgi:hypothetical protein